MFDILREGAVSPENYTAYLFPLITLYAMEEIDNDFYSIPEHARWSNTIRNGKEIGERLDKAIAHTEESNNFLKSVLSIVSYESFEDAHLHNLTLHINQIPKEKLGDIADQIIFQSSEYAGKNGENYLTSYTVTELMISLLKIKDGSSVNDPTCGVGTSFTHSNKVADNLSFYGQESNQETWAIAKMNAFLHDLKAEIRLGDTLRNPLFLDNNGLKTFDYILMDPPYGLMNWGYEEAKKDIYGRFFYGIPPKSRGDMAFVLHVLASLNEKGKAAILLPNGALFRGGSEAKIRQKIIDADLIEGVIGLPAGVLLAGSIAVSIVLFNKQKSEERKGKILFINAEEEFEQRRRQKYLTEQHREKITETFLQGKEKDGFSKWIANEQIIDSSLDVNSYFHEEEIDVSIGKVHVNKEEYEINETVPLKQIATLFRGMNPPSQKKQEGELTHRLVELSHVHEGKLDLESLTRVSGESVRNVERYELREGDVILSSRGTAIKIAVIPKLKEPTLLSNHFICIRPNEGINPFFIKAFLESPLGMFYLVNSQKGSAVTILTNKDIENIPFPDLSLEEQNSIANGILQSDKVYEEKLKAARAKHTEDYERLYEKMGLAGSYKKLDK